MFLLFSYYLCDKVHISFGSPNSEKYHIHWDFFHDVYHFTYDSNYCGDININFQKNQVTQTNEGERKRI